MLDLLRPRRLRRGPHDQPLRLQGRRRRRAPRLPAEVARRVRGQPGRAQLQGEVALLSRRAKLVSPKGYPNVVGMWQSRNLFFTAFVRSVVAF